MKVEKQKFDALLSRLLRAAPIKREDIRTPRSRKKKQPKPSR